MTAFETRIARPVAVKEPRKYFRLHRRLRQGLIASFAAGVVFAIGINLRDEQNVFAIGSPERAISFGGQQRELARFAGKRPRLGIECRYPDLRASYGCRSIKNAFAVRRKSATVLACLSGRELARFASCCRHDP